MGKANRGGHTTLLFEAGVGEWVAHQIGGHVLPGMAKVHVHPTWMQFADALEKVATHHDHVRSERTVEAALAVTLNRDGAGVTVGQLLGDDGRRCRWVSDA